MGLDIVAAAHPAAVQGLRRCGAGACLWRKLGFCITYWHRLGASGRVRFRIAHLGGRRESIAIRCHAERAGRHAHLHAHRALPHSVFRSHRASLVARRVGGPRHADAPDRRAKYDGEATHHHLRLWSQRAGLG